MESKQHSAKQPVGQWKNQRGIKKIPCDKWNTIFQNLWEAAKTVVRGKIIVIQTYPNNRNLKLFNITPKPLESRIKPKVRRRKEITKVRVEINEIETKKKQTKQKHKKRWTKLRASS